MIDDEGDDIGWRDTEREAKTLLLDNTIKQLTETTNDH